MSLRSELGRQGTDGETIRASFDQVEKYLAKFYLNSEIEERRRVDMAERLAFYRDDTDRAMSKHIDALFESPDNRKELKDMLPLSGANSVTKRIVKIVATVYQSAAKRRLLDGDDELGGFDTEDPPDVAPPARQEAYGKIETEVKKHRKMRLAQRMAQLQNAVVLYPRRVAGTGERELRIVGQEASWAIASPHDNGKLIAFVFDQMPKVVNESADDPCYLVMDDEVFFHLNRKKKIISASIKKHGLGRIPAVLAQNEISDDQLFDWTTGRDIIRGHKAALFLDLMMLVDQKNGTKMGYLAGDTSDMGAGQQMGRGNIPTIPEGVSPGVLDLGDDPAGKIRAARQIVETLAANYNIPVSVFTQDIQATSGDHLAILKSGLSEVRTERIEDWRDSERQLAELEAKVYSIDTKGFAEDFGEVAIIRGRKEELDIRKQERSMGLSNVVDEMIKDNPGLTQKQAEAMVMRNVQMQTKFVKELRALNMPASPTTEDPGSNPDQNGGLRLTGGESGDPEPANDSREVVRK